MSDEPSPRYWIKSHHLAWNYITSFVFVPEPLADYPRAQGLTNGASAHLVIPLSTIVGQFGQKYQRKQNLSLHKPFIVL